MKGNAGSKMEIAFIHLTLAGFLKHVLEVTKVACCREQPASMAFWSFADVASNVLSRLVFAA